MNTEITAQDIMKAMYVVVDCRTGSVVGKPVVGLRNASKSAERKNQTYGAVRYSYKAV